MEWTESIRRTIQYLENHLLENEEELDLSKEIGVSGYYLQKGFKFMTGFTISEYVRNRRLYLAALDVLAGKDKIIDIAFKYGYDTPESFSKAFSRFHGMAPMQLKKEPYRLQVFQPLKIKIEITGGNDMDYVVEKMDEFEVIGFGKEISYEKGYEECPKFWDEFCVKYLQPLFQKEKPEGAVEETICNSCIGQYGVCVDDIGKPNEFLYMIAGTYHGGEVPEGMQTYKMPAMEWAKFTCKGPMPGALQAVNTKIFNEWLPGNPDYEIAMNINIEWYSRGDNQAADYESGIWIPVVRKQK